MVRSRLRLHRPCVWAAALAVLSLLAPSVLWAGIVDTGQWLAHEQRSADHAALTMQRAQVAQQLVDLGVDPELVEDRIAQLTPGEVHELAERMDEMPAGAGAVNTVILVFLVLLITDIIGVTDIFPFVRSPEDYD